MPRGGVRQRWRRWLARRGAGVDRCRDPQAILGVAVGDTFTGSYTYDVNTPDMQPDPTVGTYPLTMPNEGMQIVINTITYETDPAASPIDFTLEVANRPQASNGDSFGIQSNTNRSSGPRYIETMFWALEDAGSRPAHPRVRDQPVAVGLLERTVARDPGRRRRHGRAVARTGSEYAAARAGIQLGTD